MSDSPAVVRVVDDAAAFRAAVSRLLRAAGYEVRAYESAGHFLLRDDGEAPGCVLLDLRMPGPNGLDLQGWLARQGGRLPIVFLTGHGDVPSSVRAMKAGAADFLTKPVKRETLLGAIRAALARGEDRRAEQELLRALRRRYAALSPREREVLQHVVQGRLNKQIAASMGVSERTVKAHRARCMAKMGVASVAELARAAERLEREGGEGPAVSSTLARPRLASLAADLLERATRDCPKVRLPPFSRHRRRSGQRDASESRSDPRRG